MRVSNKSPSRNDNQIALGKRVFMIFDEYDQPPLGTGFNLGNYVSKSASATVAMHGHHALALRMFSCMVPPSRQRSAGPCKHRTVTWNVLPIRLGPRSDPKPD